MNPELCQKALEKIGNPYILINLVSKRVRQLCIGHGLLSKPLVEKTEGQDYVDIALREIIEGKITWQPTEEARKREGEEHRLKRL